MEDKEDYKIEDELEDEPEFTIGKKKYEYIRKIDEGTFGKVCLVKDLNDNKEYAIKFLKENEDKNQEEYLKIFKKEIGILEKLLDEKNKDYIPRIHCSGTFKSKIKDKKVPAFVLDYVKKTDLALYVIKSDNGIGEKFSKYIFKRILEGIKICHDNNICHFDIKIENILLDDNFNPIIIDFGFSEEYKDSNNHIKTFTGKRGTRYCMCPQMFEENMQYSGIKADIFSLGVLLLGIVTRKQGFEDANYNKRYRYNLIKNKEYGEFWKVFLGENEKLSTELKNLYVKMVAYNPDERPDIDKILTDPWLKELNELNEDQKKDYIKNYKSHMKSIYNKISQSNETIEKVEQEETNQEKQPKTKGGSSYDNIVYFKSGLTSKYLSKNKINFKYFVKIIGSIKPVKFMNLLANIVQNKYKNLCYIEASEKILLFKLIIEKEDETSCDMDIILVESLKKEGEKEEQEEEKEYYVHFDRKNSSIEDFYEYFLQIKNIIKKMLN